jgi:hypothetical protein
MLTPLHRWDTRLSAAMKEKDDMQQERDAEGQRARLAEGRFAALKDRTCECCFCYSHISIFAAFLPPSLRSHTLT